jgi:hypothetical protein
MDYHNWLQIVKAVISHESALKAQAKKMNVESLRSNAVRLFPHNYKTMVHI